MRYALSLVRTSRPKAKNAPDSVKKWVAFGASVRAAQYMVLGAKARALTSGRYHVSFDDIRALAKPVMRHRVLTNFHAESERVTPDQIIDKLLYQHELFGHQRFMAQIDIGGLPYNKVAQTIELRATSVAPVVRRETVKQLNGTSS